MSMYISGTIKTGGVFQVKGKDGTEKPMISFTMVDSMGNMYPCQMWPDDPHFSDLSQAIGGYRRQQLQFAVVGYTVRLRQFKDGHTAPWANFVVSEYGQPSTPGQLSASFSGTVKAGAVNRPADTAKKPFIWFTAVDELATTYSCQVWSDDPQFSALVPLLDAGVRRQAVQFLVASYTLRERTMPDGKKNPQINFVVSDVTFPNMH